MATTVAKLRPSPQFPTSDPTCHESFSREGTLGEVGTKQKVANAF